MSDTVEQANCLLFAFRCSHVQFTGCNCKQDWTLPSHNAHKYWINECDDSSPSQIIQVVLKLIYDGCSRKYCRDLL